MDDDSELAQLASEYLELERAAFSVETASAPEEVTGELEHIDCIVSDYDMPGTNGLEFLQQVREQRSDLPFILFTGKGSEEVASEAISAGVTDYLQKRGGTSQYEVLANRIENAVERRRAREAMKFERSRRSPLFRHSPDPIIEVEYDGSQARISAVNPAFQETFDRQEADLQGRDIIDAFAADSAFTQDPADLEHIRSQVRDGQSVIEEVTRVAGDRRKEFLLRIVPFDVNGTRRAYGWYVDLTERRTAQRRFKEVFERSNEPMLVLDPDAGEVKSANPAACALLEYERDELLNCSPEDIHPHEIDRFRSFVDSVRREGQGWTDELSCRTKSGDRVAVELSASVLDPGGSREMLALLRPPEDQEDRA